MKYDYQIGIIRAKEDALLSRIDWDRLLTIPSLHDTWAELVRLNLGYQEVGVLSLEQSIAFFYSENIKNLYSEIGSYFIEEELVKSFLYELDIYNLKLTYKEKKFAGSFVGEDKFSKTSYYLPADILKYLEGEIWLDFKENFWQDIFVFLKQDNASLSPYEFDFFVDSKLFEYRLEVARKYKNEFLIGFWKMKIDFYNLKLFIGNNKEFILGGNIDLETWKSFINISKEDVLAKLESNPLLQKIAKFAFVDSTIAWESEEEKVVLEYCQKSVMFFESFEPIVSYFYKRYIEIKNINRLLYGRAFKLVNSKIEEQLSVL